MKALFATVLIAAAGVVRSEPLPRLLSQREFNYADVAEAVNHFVALGEQRACEELLRIAPNHDFQDFTERKFDLPERVGWICRILFVSRDGEPLRAPRYGGLSLPYLTMPLKSWPLFPVAHSGSSYFILSEGYSLAGLPEPTKNYLDYCRNTGVFRKDAVPVPTLEMAKRDCAFLHMSPGWLAIKWTDSGPGTSYTMSEEGAWSFIQRQANETPTKP